MEHYAINPGANKYLRHPYKPILGIKLFG